MSSSKYGKPAASRPTRQVTFFVPGAGIDREVISTDICRYLGNDATSRPGEYTDTNTGETTRGFYVTAYRALTTEQLADIKADSLRWAAEKKQPPSRGQSSGDGYRQSATRRQQWNDAPQDNYLPPRESNRQNPQGIGANRGYESSASGAYSSGQVDAPYGMADSNAKSGSGYKIATFYEASQPRTTQGYSGGPSASRPSGQGYTYATAGPQQSPVPYAYGAPSGITSAQQSSYMQQPRENSPQQPQYVDRDEDMDDYYDEYQQEPSGPSYGGRPNTRDEPSRRDDRDRHRDTRHRRH